MCYLGNVLYNLVIFHNNCGTESLNIGRTHSTFTSYTDLQDSEFVIIKVKYMCSLEVNSGCLFGIHYLSFPIPSDDTLTITNLCNALSEVEDVYSLGFGLDVPDSKRDQIRSQYPTPAQQLQPMLDEWLTSHPAPSWRVVLEALYRMGNQYGIANEHLYHTILRDVQRQYGRGECVTFTSPKLIMRAFFTQKLMQYGISFKYS